MRAFITTVVLASLALAEDVDFNRDIRPILSDKCFQCHGPDEVAREAELRLDLREQAIGTAIVPGKPDASAIIERITAHDVDERMPPLAVKKPVTRAEVDLLRKWIEQGAKYEKHWAFQPIDKDVALPEVKNTGWSRNGIDRFVLARLEAKGIKTSPEADPRTLARRFAVDVIGLLPDPVRVDRFVQAFEEDADAAVAEYIDELLASKHYGERWGRHWLDQARYADSHGYTIDGERVMWPYRDWVIHAVNRDMPFNQFTIEQLAGDLLAKPTKSQLVASAFHRNTLINQEGGTDNEQFRNEEVVDRVNTTGAVWLGLTVGCAQCHSHKFDPISHREYFELFAFFNQGEDVNNVGRTVNVAEGEMFSDEQDGDLLTLYEAAKTALGRTEKSKAERLAAWAKQRLQSFGSKAPGAMWKVVEPTTFTAEGGSVLTRLTDQSILAARGAKREVYRVQFSHADEIAAVRLRLLTHKSLPKNGPGLAGNGNIVLTRVEFYQRGQRLPVARAENDHAQPGFSAAFTIDDDPGTGWAINVGKGTAKGVKMNAPHEAHYTFVKPAVADGPIEVVLRHEINDFYNIGRFALDVSVTAPLPINDDRLRSVLSKPIKQRSGDDKKFLQGEFAKEDSVLIAARSELEEAAKAIGFGSEVSLMVMSDREQKRETFVHLRGDFLRTDKKSGLLSPNVPRVFPPLDDSGKDRNRLDLARWLVSENHPLTARVTVNRVWMRYFGKGLVETENDFGTQGSYPSHPRLLDWLATRFMKDGWSMKKLHRLILNSATYRQASIARPELKEVDPLNKLLARQNRLRFDAETVRDVALCASGLLSRKIGGPSVMPPQPDGVYSFTQNKKNWRTPTGSDRYRRATYTKFFRSAPYPLFTTFDAPDFQSVCTARARSNTPLQSLTMANDAAMFEMAKGFGARLLATVHGDDSSANRERIRLAFRICYSRDPSQRELELMERYWNSEFAGFRKSPTAAKSIAPAKVGTSSELAIGAAWTSVARTLMNTDEFITRE